MALDHSAPVLVVDRAGWVQANADAFATLLEPIVDKLTEKKPPSGITAAVGSRITGAEVGGVLGFLASKVLGQFDPFFAPDGRLLLVAPNIVHVERELEADPHDFRLWVCLHEETHRVQFTAVPWMREHLFSADRPVRRDDGALRDSSRTASAGSWRGSRTPAPGAAASSTWSGRRSRRSCSTA